MPELVHLRARVRDTIGQYIRSASSSSISGRDAGEESKVTQGAIAGIAVAGALLLFIALAPLLILLAKWQDRRRMRRRRAAYLISNSAFALHGDDDRENVVYDNKEGGNKREAARRVRSKRLRKKSLSGELQRQDDGEYEDITTAAMTAAGVERGGMIRRPSLPVLPHVVSHQGSFTFDDPFVVDSANRNLSVAGDGSESIGIATTTPSQTAVPQKQRSSDKQRGYQLYQHRRKTSWIDEDALHGPRISSPQKKLKKRNNSNSPPKESQQRKRSWSLLTRQGLRRTLYRPISMRASRAFPTTLLEQSPTLPYTESGTGAETRRGLGFGVVISSTPTKYAALSNARGNGRQGSGVLMERVTSVVATIEGHEVEMGRRPRPVAHQPYQGHPVYEVRDRAANDKSISRKSHDRRARPDDGSDLPSPNGIHNPGHQRNHSVAALHATQQLAGQARVPVPMSYWVPNNDGASGAGSGSLSEGDMLVPPRRNPSRIARGSHNNTDAELEAILRRTTQRLQDGSNRRGRRQTMMLPASRSCPGGGRNQGLVATEVHRKNKNERGDGSTAGESMNPSPAKSQNSAPAAMTMLEDCAELEGCSPIKVTIATPTKRNSETSNTPRHLRTHSRKVSHASQISLVSEPDSLVVWSNRRVSSEMQNTALTSPSRHAAKLSPTSSRSPQHHLQSQPQISARQSPTKFRPDSNVSSESSALSTVYSEEETPMQRDLELPNISPLRLNFARYRNSLDGIRQKRKFPFESGQSPQALRLRKGTTFGDIILGPTGSSPADPRQRRTTQKDTEREPSGPPTPPPHGIFTASTPSSFTIHTPDSTTDDPFTVTTPSPRNPRLSRIFSPLPAELPGSELSSPKLRTPASPTSAKRGTRKVAETPTPTQTCKRTTPAVMPPRPTLRAMMSSPTLAFGQGDKNEEDQQQQRSNALGDDIQRRPSPPVSEAGLSSVYDSYMYSNAHEDVQAKAKEAASAKTAGHESGFGALEATDPRYDHVESEKARLYSPTSRKRQQTQTADLGNESSVVPGGPSTASTASSSRFSDDGSKYSQDESNTSHSLDEFYVQSRGNAGDAVFNLVPSAKMNTPALHLTSTVAELRRMNSQVSHTSSGYSGYSNGGGDRERRAVIGQTAIARTETGSQVVHTMRHGQTGTSGGNSRGSRHYLSLDSPPRKGVNDKSNKKGDNDKWVNGENTESRANAPNMGAVRRSRRGTMIGSGLDARASAQHYSREKSREILREGISGGNARTTLTRGESKHSEDGSRTAGLVTHATRLVREEGAIEEASVESLGLYDEKGFLRSSPLRQELSSPLSKRT